jgi:hypothetical protein
MSMKLCTQCKLDKELSDFSSKGNGKVASRCKKCLAQNRRDNYEKHPKVISTSEIKTCKSCLAEKSINDFYKNYNCQTYRNECKDCNNSRTGTRRKELRVFSKELKSVPCMDCKVEYPYYVMDFDHRDGLTKEYNLSDMRFCSKEKFLEEASKCDIVCANCHRERTYNRGLERRELNEKI